MERQLLARVFCVSSFGDSQSLERFASCHGIIAHSEVGMLCREANDEQPFVEQQLPSVELHRSKGRFLFPSLLGQNVPLCAVEDGVDKLGDVSSTTILLS